MYKVPIDVLKNCKDRLKELTKIIEVKSTGKDLYIDKKVNEAKVLIKLLTDNYDV